MRSLHASLGQSISGMYSLSNSESKIKTPLLSVVLKYFCIKAFDHFFKARLHWTAHFSPSMAAEMIPPAYPAPSPQG